MKADFHFLNHVRLIQKETACPEGAARMQAWMEGPIGYHRRLGQMELPLSLHPQPKVYNPEFSKADPAKQPEVKK